MREQNVREQPLKELIEMFEALQKKEKTQESLVRKFQELIQKEGLSSQAINCFPYPMAAFRQDGVLAFVNNALSERTGLCMADLPKGKHSILNRITGPNFQILDAVENVFAGEVTYLSGLSDSLDMFVSESSSKKVSSANYRNAIFFPIAEEEGQIILGAVVFME